MINLLECAAIPLHRESEFLKVYTKKPNFFRFEEFGFWHSMILFYTEWMNLTN